MIRLQIYADSVKSISKEIYLNPENYSILSIQKFNKNQNGGLILEVVFLISAINQKEIFYVESDSIDSFLLKFGLPISNT